MALNGLIAKKIGMTRVIDEAGQMVPVTLLQIETQKITKVLTAERDGYSAYQIGYYKKPEHRLTKADIGRLRKVSVEEGFARFTEVRAEANTENMTLGRAITLQDLEGVSAVDITGVTKGKGFESAITRWGHAVGRMSHGSMYHRRPGSLGMRTTPGRVFKNKHVPGHMGSVQRTIMNLKVVDLNVEQNVIAIRGSIPGHRDAFVLVRPSIKTKETATK